MLLSNKNMSTFSKKNLLLLIVSSSLFLVNSCKRENTVTINNNNSGEGINSLKVRCSKDSFTHAKNYQESLTNKYCGLFFTASLLSSSLLPYGLQIFEGSIFQGTHFFSLLLIF